MERASEDFSKLMQKLIKDIRRQEKIMARSDKRQKQEYDELQRKLEEVQELQLAQKELMDSFIRLIAATIDAKSPYTGGHCERVPELAIMLAEAASASKEIDFEIKNDDEKREISIAAWLHDCGKVITPEHIVDKATKLEAIYNRIHEIRTRFEVLHRDLTIQALQKKLEGQDAKEVDKWLEEEHSNLQEEFAFIAKMNVGGEFITDESKNKIKQIASKEWIRHFDNTIGLSHIELELFNEEEKSKKPPVTEKLLDDKSYHILPRSQKEIEEFKRYDFKVEIPKNIYNKGEVYNLLIGRGTLTKEDFYKIQEHVIMTIKMLEQLPFPENLKNVPLYAGAHHETLIGTGYPRKLSKDELPIPARIMAIADVFEALTASDRPYKEPKTLSQAIKILSFMAKDGHLDKDLFKLFLKSNIHMIYAKNRLKPEQIDNVDIEPYLKI